MSRKPFTKDLQQSVAARIDAVPVCEPVTWEQVQTFAGDLGVDVTRQWLHRTALVSEAYNRHKEARKLSLQEAEGVASEADNLRLEIRRLRKLLQEADHRFIRWLYNAKQKNIGIDQLDRRIPDIEA